MTEDELEVVRCDDCHVAFAGPRRHCPRCGSRSLALGHLPASGTVLASTELQVAPSGFDAPHRLVLLELEEGVRLLATCRGPPPARDRKVRIAREEARYVVVA